MTFQGPLMPCSLPAPGGLADVGDLMWFDASAAQSAAKLLQARAQRIGPHQIPNKLAELQIAGIAAAYGLTLATRNVGDFAGLRIGLISPWDC